MWKDKSIGAFIGLAIGDALGAPVEFKATGTFPHVSEMMDGGPFMLKAGQWTDDTSLALCLADSLVEKGFDLQDQLNKFYLWYDEGYNSSTGFCFDIGGTTQTALNHWKKVPWKIVPEENGLKESDSNGNGSIMRLASVPIWALYRQDCLDLCELSSKTTHGHITSVGACRYLGEVLILNILNNSNKLVLPENIRDQKTKGLKSLYEREWINREEKYIHSSGYVLDTLELALWCVYHTSSFEEAVIKAVNFGFDSDTNAAVTGQIAGAVYGYRNIPDRWLKVLHDHDRLHSLAKKLVHLAEEFKEK